MSKLLLAALGLLVGCARPIVEPDEPALLVVPPIVSVSPAPPRSVAPLTAMVAGTKRVRDLLEHEEWMGKPVVVDIIEPLLDADHSSAADEGEYDVQAADDGPKRFKIAPGASADERAAGALGELPKDLRPPLRVSGVLARSKIGMRLVAHEIEPTSFPTPVRVPNGKALSDDPLRWAGRYVQVEDTLETGFEHSALATGSVWVSLYPSAKQQCVPPASASHGRSMGAKGRVRITGYAYTETGRYGHLGMARAELLGTELVYLDPARPECR